MKSLTAYIVHQPYRWIEGRAVNLGKKKNFSATGYDIFTGYTSTSSS